MVTTTGIIGIAKKMYSVPEIVTTLVTTLVVKTLYTTYAFSYGSYFWGC